MKPNPELIVRDVATITVCLPNGMAKDIAAAYCVSKFHSFMSGTCDGEGLYGAIVFARICELTNDNPALAMVRRAYYGEVK